MFKANFSPFTELQSLQPLLIWWEMYESVQIKALSFGHVEYKLKKKKSGK